MLVSIGNIVRCAAHVRDSLCPQKSVAGLVGKMARELYLRIRVAQMIVHNQKQPGAVQLGLAVEAHHPYALVKFPGAGRGFRFQSVTRIFRLHRDAWNVPMGRRVLRSFLMRAERRLDRGLARTDTRVLRTEPSRRSIRVQLENAIFRLQLDQRCFKLSQTGIGIINRTVG